MFRPAPNPAGYIAYHFFYSKRFLAFYVVQKKVMGGQKKSPSPYFL